MTPRRSWHRATIAAGLALLSVLGMILVSIHVSPRQVVAGDAHYVFASARSLAYDGDLDLTNQYAVMGDRWGLGRDPTHDGWRLPPREIGASLVMVPGLWLHHLAGIAPRWEPTCACLLAAASLGICWLGCARIVDTLELGPRRAELLAGAAVLGFVVPFYALGSAGYAHAPDAAICAWLCWALLKGRGPLSTGVLLACAVLTRMQNVLWLLWPAVEVLAPPSATDRRDQLRRVAIIASVGALGFAPQLWLGLAHPGSARGSLGWTLAFFNLDDYLFDLARVQVGVHGLLRWTPIAALALLGLALADRRSPNARALGPLAVFVGLWLLLAAVRDVDGGDAFGARRMAGIVGILALGLGHAWSRIAGRGPDARPWTAWSLAAALTLAVVVNLGRTHQAIVGELSLTSPDRSGGRR
ncbi:hypothetical protein [Enhygromyxa salina]|uniref:hypothetical protein n=1 Tax=Enhygromyxa salina TaxID=215803 RepID=UPI000D0908B8|nr:hypothetical protein [Enhygromyxa salina]